MSAKPLISSHNSFLQATLLRRSTLSLRKSSPIPDPDIISTIQHSILHTPSPFHIQSARAVVLLRSDHEKFWDMAYAASQAATPAELFNSRFVPNLAAFRGAYGTVLFFEDEVAVEDMPPMLGNLIKNFPEWGEHSNGMAQYITWTALCSAGLGCNLQHYQKYIGQALNDTWKVPESWVCKAQLVFGTPDGPPRGGVEKKFANIEERMRVFRGDSSE